MIFKTHPAHINQLKGAIEAFGPVYFHGDGNIYPVDNGKKLLEGETSPSDFRKKFGNPKTPEASYRIRFNSIHDVPGTVDEINDLLTRAKDAETRQATTPEVSPVATFKAYGSDKPAGPVVDKEKEALKAERDDAEAKAAATEQAANTLARQLEETRAELAKMKAATQPAPESPAENTKKK